MHIQNLIGFFIILSLVSCNRLPNNSNNEKPIARVIDKYLYPTDIAGIVPAGTPSEDSIRIINNYIEKWIRTRLLLSKAELNLSPEQKDVRLELEDYRSSLLIFRYEQQWLQNNLDTSLSENEMKDYYESYMGNFILQQNIIKASFIKIDKNSPNIDRIKTLYKSSKPADIEELKKLCVDFATKFDTFGSEWIAFDAILKEIPFVVSDQAAFLANRKYLEVEDDNYLYLLNIKDYKLKNDQAPFSFIKNNVKQILLNKRKFQLINQLENNIYNDALNYGYIEKYTKK